MRNLSSSLGFVAVCALLAGCGDHSDQHGVTVVYSGNRLSSFNTDVDNLAHGSLRLSDRQVIIHADGAPDASITADGDLRVNQQPVATAPAERDMLKAYYSHMLAIHSDGIAIGKAGAAVGKQAVESVATRLLSGQPDRIEQDVHSKTKLFTAAAMKICQDLSGIKTSQDQLAANLPAFKPYGNVISGSDITDCAKDND